MLLSPVYHPRQALVLVHHVSSIHNHASPFYQNFYMKRMDQYRYSLKLCEQIKLFFCTIELATEYHRTVHF